MIKPTIGRVVLVYRGKSDQAEPALICYVHSDRCINVAGFDCNGNPFAATSMQLLQDDDVATNSNYYAEWMPYQVAQAAKEALGDKVEVAPVADLVAVEAPAPVTEPAIEQEIQAKGLTAPRITPDMVDAAIVGEQYYVFPDTTLTVCCLTLANGFAVTGESACASPENFDAELGQKIARQNARDKIWALEGYALRSKLKGE